MPSRPRYGLTLLALAAALASGMLASATPAQEPRPNLLFVIADDWGGHSGINGDTWVDTPAFDRVAREGVRFLNCFTSNPKCSPCRASLLTGRNAWQTEEAMCHFGVFPNRWAVYPDVLEQNGYHVGFTGKGWGPGDFRAGGFQRNPAGPEYSRLRLKPPHQAMSNVDYAGNFAEFLKARKAGQPFAFWLGTSEPHLAYEPGIGRRAGKNPAAVRLPRFYPDSPVIRDDFLDYAVETEWFDRHLGLAVEHLEKAGELDNTVVVVTSDHGAPLPRIKGQIYEPGFHLPLAVRWGKRIKAGRTVEDFINIRDLAPTFLELAGVKPPASMTGRSFRDALLSQAVGWLDRSRTQMLIGKERHDIGRPNDLGYPVRAIRTPDYLYVRNYFPDRWPVGNPETGYRNADDCPTKTFLLSRFDQYYRLCFGKRPEEELFRVREDPDCVTNLAADPALRQVKQDLRTEMERLLKADGDPRALGRGEVFDTYKYLGPRHHGYENFEKFHRPGGAE
jgi:N-sulfoglucosamine sulfohydrolase